MWPKMWSILENVPRALEKVYSSALGWNVLKISMRPILSNVSFKTSVSLLSFCFHDLSIGVSGVLTIIVLLSVSHFKSVTVCLIEVLLCWVHRYLQLLCLPLGLIPWSLCSVLPYLLWYSLSSTLSDMRIAIPAFFCFLFAWNIFFHTLTFSLYVSLGLKWVSYILHIYRSCFCIHSASLCLLVGVFNPFTFKIIIEIYVPISIFLIVWGLFL